MKFVRWILLFIVACGYANADSLINESSISAIGIPESVLVTYVTDKVYHKTVIEEQYGQLLSESLVVQYTPKGLTRFLNNKICNNIYWFNCSANLTNLQQFTGIDISEESSLIDPGITKVNAYRINYTTQGMDNTEHNVSGAVLVPQSATALKGVILFYHYTILNKHNAPSYFESDETQLSRTLAATMASNGYVVVIPDYIGEGNDESSVHPYILYPQNNALSGINMLRTLKTLESNLHFSLVQQRIPLFISGYSEGSSYALWASKILQENPNYLKNYGYKLTKVVPISGAYNLSKVTFGFLLESSPLSEQQPPYFVDNLRVADFLRPALVVNALDAYVNYSLNAPESSVFSAEFGDCNYCQFKGESYTVTSLLNNSLLSEFTKYRILFNAASKAGYAEKNNSVLPLVNQAILPSNDFRQQLISADIDNWKSSVPINFIALENDSVVTRLNSEVAYYAMAKQGSTALNITLVPNQSFKAAGYIPLTDIDIDHGSAIPFMFLFARNSFNESLTNVHIN